MQKVREVLERTCPCCGGNGWYAGTGTETIRGKDGCPEPSPCEVQVQCDCNGIKIAEIKKIVLGWVGEDKKCEYKTHRYKFYDCLEFIGYNKAKREIRESIRKGESV